MGRPSETPVGASSAVLDADELPRPLDMMGKLNVIDEWIQPAHGLRYSEIKVLQALVRRQNPKTGQCNPGVTTLMTDTGLKERAVRGALAKLQKAGALWKNDRPGAKRKFVIVPVELLGAGKPANNFRSGKSMHSAAANMHSHAGKPCRSVHTQKIKETKKKIDSVCTLTN